MSENFTNFFAALLASSASAVPITISTYSMNNGQAGSQTYFDDTYVGTGGNANVANSPLSGGTGQLTDGILAPTDIFADEWVGWNSPQPTITLDLGSLYHIDKISFHTSNWSPPFNDVGVFGSATRSYSTDGVNFTSLSPYLTTAADRSGDDPRFVDISFDIDARYVRVTLNDGVKAAGTSPGGPKPWIFLSELTADGTAIPEPATVALLALGLAGIGIGRRAATRSSR